MDLIMFDHSGGVHQWNVTLGGYSSWAKVSLPHRLMRSLDSPPQTVHAKEIINTPVLFLTKLSILLQFERIFAPSKAGKAYWSIRAVIWFNALYYLSCTISTVFLCHPLSHAWQPWNKGHCGNVRALIVISSLINVASDILIIVIPVVCISNLQMRTSRKVGVGAVFVVGVL